MKRRSRPRYLDTAKEPYAKFVFKYRTRQELHSEMKVKIDTEPSGDEEMQSFQNMAKDDLIEMLVRAKGALGGKIPSPPPASSNDAKKLLKGIVVDAPTHDFLEYDLPEPRGEGSSVGEDAEKRPDNASSEGWSNVPQITVQSTCTNTNTGSNWAADGASGGTTTQFPKESWEQAHIQQQSGPAPDPPHKGVNW